LLLSIFISVLELSTWHVKISWATIKFNIVIWFVNSGIVKICPERLLADVVQPGEISGGVLWIIEGKVGCEPNLTVHVFSQRSKVVNLDIPVELVETN